MDKKLVWVVIGDSISYQELALEEATRGRLKEGYISRTKRKLSFDVDVINLGVNGYKTSDWLNLPIEKGDFYTIFLGTNDWFYGLTPIGDENSFINREPNTILGNVGVIIDNIRKVNKDDPIFVMNPIERSIFVCVYDHFNVALITSEKSINGKYLRDIAESMLKYVKGDNIIPVDIHGLSGITTESCVKFQRRMIDGEIKDVKYPKFLDLKPFDGNVDKIYPYPIEAIGDTFDGLHASDKGCEKIAIVLSKAINDYYKNK